MLVASGLHQEVWFTGLSRVPAVPPNCFTSIPFQPHTDTSHRSDELARILDRVVYIGMHGGWATDDTHVKPLTPFILSSHTTDNDASLPISPTPTTSTTPS